MEVGEEWVYRANQRDPVAQVRMLRIGTNRPPRVLVRFVADEFEGREEWVSPARLKTLWRNVEQWVANDQRWQAIRDASWRHREDPELIAAGWVLDERDYLPGVTTGYNKDAGLLFIDNVDGLSAKLGVPTDEVTGDPLCITSDDGSCVAPFSTMLVVAKRAARVFADQVLAEVAEKEAKARREAVHGSYYRRSRGEDDWFEPEICIHVNKIYAPARALLRDWCGQDAAERRTELVALRDEVFRLGKLVERAITALAKHDKAAAGDLEKELGIPVETLRHSRRHEN